MSQQELFDFLMYLKQDIRPSVSSELLEKLGHIESLSTTAEGETCRYMTDTIAANLYAEDADRSLGPVRVYGDGNCLYRSALLLVCGNESRHVELRLRTAIELCKNVQHYAYAVVQHARSCLESLSPVALLLSTLKTESSAVFAEALESGCSLEESYCLAALIEIHATCSPGCYSSVLHAYGLSTTGIF